MRNVFFQDGIQDDIQDGVQDGVQNGVQNGTNTVQLIWVTCCVYSQVLGVYVSIMIRFPAIKGLGN
jgi:hypothetical protein